MSKEDNVTLTKRVFEGLAGGELTAAQEVLGPDLRRGGDEGARLAQQVFPDLRLTLEDTVAEGDKVVARWTATGTHKGEGHHHLFGPVKATGRKISVTGITILRFEDGQVVETWGVTDELGVAHQLGVVRGHRPRREEAE